jgi:hypothetical protein
MMLKSPYLFAVLLGYSRSQRKEPGCGHASRQGARGQVLQRPMVSIAGLLVHGVSSPSRPVPPGGAIVCIALRDPQSEGGACGLQKFSGNVQ